MAAPWLPADPYLAWSHADGFRGHAAVAGGGTPIPVLIEANEEQMQTVLSSGLLQRPGAAPTVADDDCRYLTGVAAWRDLPALEAEVKRLEFGLPLRAGAVDTVPPPAYGGKAPAGLVLAAVDRGCALLNPCFLGPDQQRRLIGLWDQGRAAGPAPWKSPPGFGYGRELDGPAIDGLLARLPATGEAALYRELDYLVDGRGLLDETAHGTHVLDVLAGRCDRRRRLHSSAKPAKDDAASKARLVFVELPQLTAGNTTGAAPGAHLIDALHYIRSRAGPRARVIVNLSIGALAGPHDGSSLVERALDAFIAADGRMQIVVAAGNAALERWHASGTLGDAAPTAALHWRLMPDDPTDSFMEVWFAAGAGPVELRLRPPAGPPGPWVPMGGNDVQAAGGRSISGVFGRHSPGKGKGSGKAMFLVAVAPCTGDRRAATAGRWTVELRRLGGPPCRFDAWLQRDEPDEGSRLPVQSFLECVEGAVRIERDGTENSLATGRRTEVVGAREREGGRISRYSADGPRVVHFETADESAVATGLLAASVARGTLVRMGGTSVAAPAFARQRLVARSLSAGPPPGHRPARRPWPREP